MRDNTTLYLTLLCAIVAVTLHSLALTHYFYWTYWWFDVLVHFFVGFTGGLGIYWGLFDSGWIFRSSRTVKFRIVVVLFCVLAWGVAWEVYEYVNAINDSNEGYVLDTINDLILDSSGAVLAALFATRKKKTNV